MKVHILDFGPLLSLFFHIIIRGVKKQTDNIMLLMCTQLLGGHFFPFRLIRKDDLQIV